MSTPERPSSRFSRRLLLGAGAAAATFVPLVSAERAAASFATSPGRVLNAAATTASPAGWRTWHLKAPDELRPAAPGAATSDEIAKIIGFQTSPTADMTAAIATWGVGPANIAWTTAMAGLIGEFADPGRLALRHLAIFHTALSDAALAAWDAQVANPRPGPAAADSGIKAVAGVDPAAPSFPSTHAALAGAAAEVLNYVFPTAVAGRFDAMANEAAMSRVWAGAAFPSDMAAGLAMGKAIGQKAVAYAKADGSDAKWDKSTMPKGPGIWQPTPPKFADPLAPLGGTWKAWILSANDMFRPAAPPKYGSDVWKAEQAAVEAAVANRTFDEERLAIWYVTSPFPPFNAWAAELIQRAGLDTPHSTRVMAYLNVAYADASIAVWDAKYTWWTSRPITANPKLAVTFATPPYPSYPSGYSSVAGSGSMVLSSFFPAASHDMDELAWEATRSRGWSGVHYMTDNEIGLAMGRSVGRLVYALAAADGAAAAS